METEPIHQEPKWESHEIQLLNIIQKSQCYCIISGDITNIDLNNLKLKYLTQKLGFDFNNDLSNPEKNSQENMFNIELSLFEATSQAFKASIKKENFPSLLLTYGENQDKQRGSFWEILTKNSIPSLSLSGGPLESPFKTEGCLQKNFIIHSRLSSGDPVANSCSESLKKLFKAFSDENNFVFASLARNISDNGGVNKAKIVSLLLSNQFFDR